MASLEGLRARLLTLKDAKEDPAATEEFALALEELEVLWEELEDQTLQLAREREQYAAVFEHAPYACLVTDGRGIVLRANRAAVELLGVSPHYVVNKPLLIFLDEQDRRDLVAHLVHLGSQPRITGETWRARLKRITKAVGAKIEIRVNSVPDAKGMPATLIWFLHATS